MAGKLPGHFKFFWKDWMSSASVQGMSLAEQGAYLRMLCVQFDRGSVDIGTLPGVLGVSPEEVDDLFDGPLGGMFHEIPDGTLVNPRLAEEREAALGRSTRNRRAALARWADKKGPQPGVEKPMPPEPAPKRTRKRVDGRKELEGAIALFEVRGVTVPRSMLHAMEEYRRMRAENGMPVWRKNIWLKNMSEDFSLAEWEQALADATRSMWRSIHPKRGVGPGANGNPFGEQTAMDVEMPLFHDPNMEEEHEDK